MTCGPDALFPCCPNSSVQATALHVLYPSRRHLPLAVSAFIDLVVEKLSELDAAPILLRA